jgi:Sodium:sulfate symporter transmembrane region
MDAATVIERSGAGGVRQHFGRILCILAMLGTSMPLLMNFANMHNLNPMALGMIWTFGSAGKLFVYQSAVLIVGYSFGYFKTHDLLRIGLLLTLVEFVAILVIVPFYWPMIGIQRRHAAACAFRFLCRASMRNAPRGNSLLIWRLNVWSRWRI